MGVLTVRKVDDALIRELKLRAARNGRSAEAEHRLILEQALRTSRGKFVKLELPRAQGEAAAQQARVLDILVNADGRYFVGDREALRTDVESLKRTITEVAGSDRKRTVLLRADARTPHQAVVTALDALGQLGFRQISIGTAPEAGGARP